MISCQPLHVEIGVQEDSNPACPPAILELQPDLPLSPYHLATAAHTMSVVASGRYAPPWPTTCPIRRRSALVVSTPHNLDTRGHAPSRNNATRFPASPKSGRHLRALVVVLPGDPVQRPTSIDPLTRKPRGPALSPGPRGGRDRYRGARVAASPSPGKPAPAHPQKAGQRRSRDHARR